MKEQPFPKASVINFTDNIDYAPGGVVSIQILKSDAGNISLFAFDDRQGLSEHTAPFDATVMVLEGEVEIKIDDKTFRLKSGESIIMPAGVKHSLQAIRRFKMLLTMIKG